MSDYIYIPGTTEPPLGPEPPGGWAPSVYDSLRIVPFRHAEYQFQISYTPTTKDPLDLTPEAESNYEAAPQFIWTCEPVVRDGHINIIGCALASATLSHWTYETEDDILWVDGTPEEFIQDSPSPFVPPGTPPYYITHFVYTASGGLTTLCLNVQFGWSCMDEPDWGGMDEGEWTIMEDGCAETCPPVPVTVHIPYISGADGVGLVIEALDSALVQRSNYFYQPSDPGFIIVPEPGVHPVASHWIYVGGGDGIGLVIVPDPGADAIYSHRVYTAGTSPSDWMILDGFGAELHVGWIYIPVTQEVVVTAPLNLGGEALLPSNEYTPGTDVDDAFLLNGSSEVGVIHWIFYAGEVGGLLIEAQGPGALYPVNYEYIPGTFEDALVIIDPGALVDGTHFVYVSEAVLELGGSSIIVFSEHNFFYDPVLVPLTIGGTSLLKVGYIYIVEPPAPGLPSLLLGGTAGIVASHWIYRTYPSISDVLVLNGLGGEVKIHLIYIPVTQEILPGVPLILGGTSPIANDWTYIPGSTIADVILLDGYTVVVPSDYQYTPGVTAEDSLVLNGELVPFVDYYISHYHYIPSPMDRLLLDGRQYVVSSAWSYIAGQDGGLYIVPEPGWTHYYWIQTRDYLWIADVVLILNGTSPASFEIPSSEFVYNPGTTPDDRLILNGQGSEAAIIHFIWIPDLLDEFGDAWLIINSFVEMPGNYVFVPTGGLVINGYTTWYGNARYYIPPDGLHIGCQNTFVVTLHLSYVSDAGDSDGWLILNGDETEYSWDQLPPPPEPPEPLIRRYTPIDVILPTSQKRREEEFAYAVFRFGMEEPVVPLLYETQIEAIISKQDLEKEMAAPNLASSMLSVRKVVTYQDEIVRVI